MKKGTRIFSILFAAVFALLPLTGALGEELYPLPMDSTAVAPPPKDECFLSKWEYADPSITVRIMEGAYASIPYTAAYVKISHPSQLRAVTASQVRDQYLDFDLMFNSAELAGQICAAANAVVGINGDFFTAERCKVVLRQGKQVRNRADGDTDLLIIDKNGDFYVLGSATRDSYANYYKGHAEELYQVYCFGPVLVRNGESVIDEFYRNTDIIASLETQRSAICQLGPLEYLLVTSDGDSLFFTYGLTIYDFALLCERLGKQLKPETGMRLAYNLDGGNSAALVFKRRGSQGTLMYEKLNMPERERTLADMICFVSLCQ